MYILFLVSLVIHTTVLVSAQQATGKVPIEQHHNHNQQHHQQQHHHQQQQPHEHHERQTLFTNQSEQFGAPTKGADETFRGSFQQTTEAAAATTTPLTGDKPERNHETTIKEETDIQHHAANRLSVTENFRLEYNKYKILSHLGITANPDELTPQLDEDLRSKLTATSAFSNNSDQSNAVRHKRSLSCNQVNGNKNTCCLENFYVNFTHIGWDKWILYPAGYNANYCRGHCDLSHARYYHSTLLSKYSNIVSLCCSPKQMGPLRLLYIDENNKVHQKTIPDMVVESCDCA